MKLLIFWNEISNFIICSQTYASNVLIAVNPYETINNLYGSHQTAKYLAAKPLFERQPHVYAIGRFLIVYLILQLSK